MVARLIAHQWPEQGDLVLEDLRSLELAVIRVAPSATPTRAAAREAIRAAIREAVGAFLSLAPASVTLESHSGRAPMLRMQGIDIGLSVSHEAAGSVAAIRWGGAVGVDIVRSSCDTNLTRHWKTIASDYLGPRTCRTIARMRTDDQMTAFLRGWTRLESRLKCLGTPLNEWTPGLDSTLESCVTLDLIGIPDLIGTVAFVPRPTSAHID